MRVRDDKARDWLALDALRARLAECERKRAQDDDLDDYEEYLQRRG